MPATPSHTAARLIKLPPEPQLLAWALVLAVAILSFFVHTLYEGIDRGENFRAAQRAGAHTWASAVAVQTPEWSAQVATSAGAGNRR